MSPVKWRTFSEINQLQLTPGIQEWLIHSGSFMARMKDYGIEDAKIRVLSQDWDFADKQERDILQLENRVYSLVREVLISSGDSHWMWARTVFPQATLTGKEQLFKKLKNRALGTKLFQQPNVRRSEFHFASLPSHCSWQQKIKTLVPYPQQNILARRSVFYINGKPLLLSEVFLPDIIAVMTA